MEFRITPVRLLLFIALLAGFWWIGGFSFPPALGSGTANTRALLYRIAMFVCGAGCATIVEHEVGTMDRTSLRGLYIVLGIGMMIGAAVWTRALHTA